MADNVEADAGSGGATFAADDISGVHYPRTKIVVGADGVNDGDVSAANPLPVDGTGTAGTAAGGVLTVQGVASMTPIQVGDNSASLSIDDGGNIITVDGTVAVTHDALTELAAAIDTEVQCDIVGSLPAGTNAIGKLVANSGVDIGDVDILSIAAGDNNIGNVDIVTLPTDTFVAEGGALGKGVLLQGDDGTDRTNVLVDTDGHLQVDILSSASLTVSGSVTANAGTNLNTSALALESGGNLATAATLLGTIDADTSALAGCVDSGQVQVDIVASAAIPVTDNGGALTVDNGGTFAVQPGPSTSGGLSIFRSLDLDETEEEVKASAGQVYGWYFFNASTSVRYLKFYNATAANVTVGTTTPVMTFPLPAQSSGGVAGNILGGMGIAFDTAITVAVTTGLGDSDTGAPSANDVILNVFYK